MLSQAGCVDPSCSYMWLWSSCPLARSRHTHIVLGLVRRPNQYTVVDGHLWFGSKVPRGQSDDKLFGVWGTHSRARTPYFYGEGPVYIATTRTRSRGSSTLGAALDGSPEGVPFCLIAGRVNTRTMLGVTSGCQDVARSICIACGFRRACPATPNL